MIQGTRRDRAPYGVVLLSAGRGTRMLPLTEGIPKSLLKVGNRLVLDWLIEPIIARSHGEVVVVTGYGAERVEDYLESHYGDRVVRARNERYEEDVNILSVQTGVDALQHPERGYLVVETDMLVEAAAWDRIFAATTTDSASYWVCKGVYGPALTGGIVHALGGGTIDAIDYQPTYDSRFDGWPKMLGMMIVGPQQVAADRRLRREAISETVAQYYLMPWIRGLRELPCRVLQLDDELALTFNTKSDFKAASDAFVARVGSLGRGAQAANAQPVVPTIEKVAVERLRHIEGHSDDRVNWLEDKIRSDGVWSKPLAIDADHDLVLDGQHRMEVAKRLGLKWVPAVRYSYADLEIWSLRPGVSFDWRMVTRRALADDPYPYKTVKHRFPYELPMCTFKLEELSR